MNNGHRYSRLKLQSHVAGDVRQTAKKFVSVHAPLTHCVSHFLGANKHSRMALKDPGHNYDQGPSWVPNLNPRFQQGRHVFLFNEGREPGIPGPPGSTAADSCTG